MRARQGSVIAGRRCAGPFALALAGCLIACQSVAPAATLPRFDATPTRLVSTPTTEPVAAPTSTETVAPRPAADQPGDERWQALIQSGFVVVQQSTPFLASERTIRAYVLTDGTKASVMATRDGAVNWREAYGPGSCVLAFYAWDGRADTLLGIQGEKDSPVWCDLVNWDQPTAGLFFPFPNPNSETRRLLGLAASWSDLNGDGAPEVTVVYNSCNNDCQTYDGLDVRVYEIAKDSVEDLVAHIDGVLVLPDLLVATDPPAFRFQSRTQYGFDQDVWRTSIYRWEAGQFVDHSREYPAEYRAELETIRRDLERRYGTRVQPFGTAPFLTMLDIVNESGMPAREGLDLFLEATALEHWPQTDPFTACWLQLARAYAQMGFAAGAPFRIYPMDAGYSDNPDERRWLAGLAQTVADEGYDTSLCPQDH